MMTEIQLYQPGHLNVVLPFATKWDELLTPELEVISAIQLSRFEDSRSTRAALLNSLLEIRARKQKVKIPKKIINYFDAEDAVLNGYPLLDFIFNSNTLTRQPYITLHLPGMRSTSVCGPEDDYNNLTCGEYEDSEIYYHDFVADPDPGHLAKLAAILYRPKGVPYQVLHGAILENYNYEGRLKCFERLPAAVLFTIFLWYAGCRNNMVRCFSVVFSGSPSLPETEGAGQTPKVDKLSFTKCIHAGAGPKNGTRQQIRLLPLKEFFFDMNEEAKAIRELKRPKAGTLV